MRLTKEQKEEKRFIKQQQKRVQSVAKASSKEAQKVRND